MDMYVQVFIQVKKTKQSHYHTAKEGKTSLLPPNIKATVRAHG